MRDYARSDRSYEYNDEEEYEGNKNSHGHESYGYEKYYFGGEYKENDAH